MGAAVGTSEGVGVWVALTFGAGACVAVGTGAGEGTDSSEHATKSTAMRIALVLSQSLMTLAIPDRSDICKAQVPSNGTVNGGTIMYHMGGSIAGRRCRRSAILSA